MKAVNHRFPRYISIFSRVLRLQETIEVRHDPGIYVVHPESMFRTLFGILGKHGVGVGCQVFEVLNNPGGIDDRGFACVVYIRLHDHRYLRTVARDIKPSLGFAVGVNLDIFEIKLLMLQGHPGSLSERAVPCRV